MNGHYRARLELDPHLGHTAPRRIPKSILNVQRSLERDGIAFTVEDDGEWVEVHAHGTSKTHKRRTGAAKAVRTVAPLLTVEQCTRHLKEATKATAIYIGSIKNYLHRQWQPARVDGRWSHEWDWDLVQRKRRIGHALARVIARHRDREPLRYTSADYAELDAACGRRVKRAGQLSKEYVTEYVCRYEAMGRWTKPTKPQAAVVVEVRESPVETLQNLRLDVEYWTEMLRLATGNCC